MDHPFRSAAFGGFNREDVLKYLETSAQQTAQARQELQQQLDGARERAEHLQTRVEEQEAQLQHLRPMEQELTHLQREHAETLRELAHLREENRQLRGRVEAMQPSADAYEELKERTAGVELEAHRRAQNIQDEAQAQADQLRHRMHQWMAQSGREYEALREGIETIVAHAAEELTQAEKRLKEVHALLEEREMALHTIQQDYEQTARP